MVVAIVRVLALDDEHDTPVVLMRDLLSALYLIEYVVEEVHPWLKNA